MKSKKSWLVAATVACIGCCAVPLFLIIVGASSAGVLAALITQINLDVLLCLAPLVVIAGYFIHKQHQAKRTCCSMPTGECSSTQCVKNISDKPESK